MRLFHLLLAVCLFSSLQAEQVPLKQMSRNLDILENTFSSKYAPTPWKTESFNWSLENCFSQAREEVNQKPFTYAEFHQLLRRVFASMCDYHVSIGFYSTAVSYLPFSLKEADGRVFVVWSEHPDLEVGDEILSWDHKPILDVLNQFREEEFPSSNPASEKTDRAQAAYFFTVRVGASGMKTPRGDVLIERKPKNTGLWSLFTSPIVSASWNHNPDKIGGPQKSLRAMQTGSLAQEDPVQEKQSLKNFFQKKFEWINNGLLKKSLSKYAFPRFLGQKISFVPELGEVITMSSSKEPIRAYLFRLPDNKKGGYLRIPSYQFSPKDFECFEKWIRLFETSADVLVIDQVDNPGGSLGALNTILSFLAKEPLVFLKQQVCLTQEEAQFALEVLSELEDIQTDQDAKDLLGESFLGCPANLDCILSLKMYLENTLTDWNQGKTLSSPLFLYGIDQILPHPKTHFTKPILLLINEKDFSCGDILPAVLQDNKRATLFGEKTAGAGGFVLVAQYSNLVGIEYYSHTGSLIQRLDGSFIEHVGVQPDITYTPTPKEVQDGTYSNYKAKVLEAINTLLSE